MSQYSKGHNARKIWWFFKKFNQVIYSSSPNSWPSFKPLAQKFFEISCWQDFILNFSKGHNSRKGDNSDKKKKCVSAIFTWGIHIWNFKTLSCTVLDKRMHTWMDACKDNQRPICPVNFFEVGGIKIKHRPPILHLLQAHSRPLPCHMPKSRTPWHRKLPSIITRPNHSQ